MTSKSTMKSNFSPNNFSDCKKACLIDGNFAAWSLAKDAGLLIIKSTFFF